MTIHFVHIVPPEVQDTLKLSDGRLLAWSQWGPPQGVPILFCTGAGMSSTLGFGADSLAELNVRLIALDRPGLGASSPDVTKTLDSWASDIREFIAALKLQSVLAVGFSQGAPFALTLAGYNLVQAVAIVSGQDDLTYPALARHLTADVATMLTAASDDPQSFQQYISEIFTADLLWKLITDISSEHDLELYLHPTFARAYFQSVQEGFSQGTQGYALDLSNALLPWPIPLERIKVPVDLWYGQLDTSPVHSPDFGYTMAQRLPCASLTVDPQEGSSILWTRARDILTKLCTHS
jgi:pimeloyl-ACP methyl ester carboxylesterase